MLARVRVHVQCAHNAHAYVRVRERVSCEYTRCECGVILIYVMRCFVSFFFVVLSSSFSLLLLRFFWHLFPVFYFLMRYYILLHLFNVNIIGCFFLFLSFCFFFVLLLTVYIFLYVCRSRNGDIASAANGRWLSRLSSHKG